MTATRGAPMALDGHSAEAEAAIDVDTLAYVEVVLLGLLNDSADTDDGLEARYNAKRSTFPGIPQVSPQRLRTARARLVQRGVVCATTIPGLSARGHRATVWAVARAEQDRMPLW